VGEGSLLDYSKKVIPQTATQLRKQSSAIGRLQDHVTCGSMASEISYKLTSFWLNQSHVSQFPSYATKSVKSSNYIQDLFNFLGGEKRKKRVPTMTQRSK